MLYKWMVRTPNHVQMKTPEGEEERRGKKSELKGVKRGVWSPTSCLLIVPIWFPDCSHFLEPPVFSCYPQLPIKSLWVDFSRTSFYLLSRMQFSCFNALFFAKTFLFLSRQSQKLAAWCVSSHLIKGVFFILLFVNMCIMCASAFVCACMCLCVYFTKGGLWS